MNAIIIDIKTMWGYVVLMTTTLNTKWFKDQFTLKRVSQKKLADYLKLDPSAITFMLQGKRRMQMDEAVQIARFLGSPVEEVLRNAGIPVKGDNAQQIPLVGYIDGHNEAHIGEPTREIEAPMPLPAGTVAVRIDSQSFPIHGAVLFFRPGDGVDPAAIGRLAIAKTDDGQLILCSIRPGTQVGLYDLHLTAQKVMHDVMIRAATPVLWLRP